MRFAEKSYVTLEIFSDMLQFMHISTSESGEIQKTENLHGKKHQRNSKWTGSNCVFVLTLGKHSRKAGKGNKRGQRWGGKVGLNWERLLQLF